MSEEALFAECGHCKGTGSHFDTPDYRWTGLAREGDGRCALCEGLGLILSEEARRLKELFDALHYYPKSRSAF